jgi:hypothetical protein
MALKCPAAKGLDLSWKELLKVYVRNPKGDEFIPESPEFSGRPQTHWGAQSV